jgi:hypothetical protein
MNSKRLLALVAGLLMIPALVFAGIPSPADSVICESKTVAPTAGACQSAGVKLRTFITHEDSLANVTIVYSTTSTSNGGYATLSRSGACAASRNFAAVVDPLISAAQLKSRLLNSSQYHSSSPDTFAAFFTLSDPTDDLEKLEPSSGRRALMDVKFDSASATTIPGVMEVDSSKVLANTIQFVDLFGVKQDVNYVKGILTISVPPPVILNCVAAGGNLLYGRPYAFDFNSDQDSPGPITWTVQVGPGAIDAAGNYTFAGQCPLGAIPVTVRAANAQGTFSDCQFVINVIDNAPSCTPAVAVVNVSHGALAVNTINTSDPDAGDVVSVSQTSGPGTTSPGGAWSYQTSCADIALNPQTVQEQVVDAFGACSPGPLSATCQFQLVVTNAAPSITCPPNAQVQAGSPYSANATASDADPADAGSLTFALVSGPAGLTVSPTGQVDWTPTPGDAGPNQVCIQVTDGCGDISQCCYNIQVVVGAPFRICIDTIRAYQGTDVEVGINNLEDATDPDLFNGKSVGGFSFLISYDCACLQFLSARKGSLLVTQGWEFFTYRFGSVGNGNCGSGCPSCLLRVVAIADVNNGGNHPNLTRVNQGQWAVLKFRVSNDRTLAGQCCQISWFWFDCTDNTVSDSTGNVLYVVDSLYTSAGMPVDLATAFPNNVANCDQFSGGPGKPSPKKRIIFCNGAICVPTPEEIDDRGDLNLNGVGYEIADAVLYENYFIYGPNVLSPNPTFRQSQLAASDVNGDGNILSVGDLVALIRVITGDANPLPKAIPGAAVALAMTSSGSNYTLEASSISDLGGLHLTFKVNGTVGGVTLSEAAEGMTVKTNVNGDELSVLIYSDKKGVMIAPNAGAIFTINVDGSMELAGSEASDYYGATLPTLAKGPVVPTAFGLTQNYPNPFNAKTNIQLALPVASDYTVTVYNVAGQVVKTFSGNAAAGTRTIVWDGTDNNGTGVSSGVYFYKAVAGKFSATKKMLLLQ